MKTFRIVCSKNNNRVTLVNQYNSVEEARYDVGRQGYAVIEVAELKEELTLEGVCYFEVKTPEGIRKGKIKSDDIFRAYVKLVDDLGYQVIFIYDRADADDAYKKLMTVNVEKSYAIFKEQSGAKKREAEAAKASADAAIAFHSQREIDRLRGVYAKMLAKAEGLMNTYRADFDSDTVNEMTEVINKIRTVGSISNVERLRLLGEDCLRKIGNAEIKVINRRNIGEKREFLSETNQLLKGIGSHKPVVHESDTLARNLAKLFQPLLEKIKEKAPVAKVAALPTIKVAKMVRPAVPAVKEGSYKYYHILKDIETYRKRRNSVLKEYLHALFRFDPEGIRAKRVKMELIAQNIRLQKARLSGRTFSYVRIAQGFRYYAEAAFGVFRNLADIAAWALLATGAYYVLAHSYASFFRTGLMVRPSFFLTAALAAVGVALANSCRKPVHAVPAVAALLAVSWILGTNF